MSYIKHVSCCIHWRILTFKTQRPVFCPWAHASVAQAWGVWSESFWALKRSTPTIRASDVLLLSRARWVAPGLAHQGHYSQGKVLCTPMSFPCHPSPQGTVRLIRMYEVMSITIGCFILLLIFWQFSGSESYIYIKGGQERWETASALRADTEDQLCVLGTPWIQSSGSFLSYISSLEGDNHWNCLAIFSDAKTSHCYNTFAPMRFLIHYLTLPSWVVKETQRMRLLFLTRLNRETKVWRHTLNDRTGPKLVTCHLAHVPSPFLSGKLWYCSLALRNWLQPTCHQNFTWKVIWKTNQRQRYRQPGE